MAAEGFGIAEAAAVWIFLWLFIRFKEAIKLGSICMVQSLTIRGPGNVDFQVWVQI
jgi:hypothetical protein